MHFDHQEKSEDRAIFGLSQPQFLKRLRREIRKGFSLVPFLGSGVSAPSGILMGQEFTNYLTWTVYVCIAGEGGDPNLRRDLQRQGWPKVPNDGEVSQARSWVAKEFKKLCRDYYGIRAVITGEKPVETVEVLHFEACNQEPDQLVAAIQRPMIPQILRSTATLVVDDKLRSFWHLVGKDENSRGGCLPRKASPTSEQHVIEAALRSLHDWRATLHFLARLRQVPHAAGHCPKLVLGELDQSIIDKFNVHITRGRRPNFAHSMLCHLAGPARIRIILTTNFDTLIEDAFTELHQRFEVISVGLTGALPHPDTVHSLNCVIKLHGSVADTRADYSLDDPPSEDDKRRFYSYLRGGDAFVRSARFRPGHLLVVGYSGSDLRCVQMIKFVLDLDPEAQVFWVCFDKQTQEALAGEIFPEPEYRGRVISVVSSNPDLLLYELYQQLMFCLPEGGFTYQLSPNMPFGSDYGEKASSITDSVRTAENEDAAQIVARLKDSKFVIVDSASGSSAPLRQAFNEATRGLVRTAIWLELEDYFDIEHLKHEILQTIAVRIGRFQLDHATFMPRPVKFDDEAEWVRHCRLLFDTWSFKPGSWLIVLYGRNGLGGCAGWLQTYWEPEKRTEKQKSQMIKFVESLADLGFRMIYAPYSQKRFIRDLRKEEQVHQRAERLWKSADLQKQSINNHNEEPPADQRAEGSQERGDTKKRPELFFFEEKAKETEFPPSDAEAEYRVSEGSWEKLVRKPKLQVESPRASWKGYVYCQNDPGRRFEEILDEIWRNWLGADPAQLESAPEEMKSNYNRRLFLYGCTLFRQSRHYAAFFIDTVMQCPSRFNIYGLDNDRKRFAYLDYCLKDLDRIRLFHRKPGGFAWMHRDLRLGVRHLLECMGPSEVKKDRVTGRFRQIRAAGHYVIADWYSKAFQTTGHDMPLLEALHHFAQCARFAPEAARVAEPDDYKTKSLLDKNGKNFYARMQYRRGLWKAAVQRLIKYLRMGRPVLKLRLEEPVAASWFALERPKWPITHATAGGKELLEMLETSVKELENLTKFKSVPADQAEDFKQEFGKARECWSSLEPLLTHELVSIMQAVRDQPIYSSPQGDSKSDPFLTQWIPRWNDNSKPWYEVVAEECLDVEDETDWNGQILRRLKALPLPPVDATGGGKNFLDKLGDLMGGVFDSKDDKLHGITRDFQLKVVLVDDLPMSFVELIGWLAYLCVRRAKRCEHASKPVPNFVTSASGGKKEDWEQIRRRWAQACALCRLVIDLAAHLHPRHLNAESQLRVKYSTLYGLCLGRLDRFFEAHRRLNEASAILSKSDVIGDDPPLPILKLRRAEVHILEASLIRKIAAYFAQWKSQWEEKKHKDPGDANCWVTCCHAFVLGQNADGRDFDSEIKIRAILDEDLESEKRLSFEAREAWLNLYLARPFARPNKLEQEVWDPGKEKDLPERLLSLHIAKLDEAWLTLEDAERLFSGKSQAILWWCQLRTLQLRIYAEHHFLDPIWPNFNGETNNQKATRQKSNGQRKFPSPDHPSRRFRTLAFRLQRSHAPYIRELFKQAISIASDSRDLYLFVRVLDYFLLAHKHATNADELQRDPAADLLKAEHTHKKEVETLLNTARDIWCSKLFDSFKKELRGVGLLSKYCRFVDEAYKNAGYSILRASKAEPSNRPAK